MNRIALVIGNSAYDSGAQLNNAAGDAEKAAKVLQARNFTIRKIVNGDEQVINSAVNWLAKKANKADVALLYLAGHAVERSGVGFFLPTDFPFPVDADATSLYGIGLDKFVAALRPAKSAIVILDACRNWPPALQDQTRLGEKLDQMAAAEKGWNNVLLAYSTSSMTAAGDGRPGEGSQFCLAFCRHMLDHTITIDECFMRIGQDVVHSMPGKQQPWTYSSLQRGLSISDLPRFLPSQRHNVPAAGAWSSLDWKLAGMVIGSDYESVWHVDPASSRRIDYLQGEAIVGVAHLKDHFVTGTRKGDLHIGGAQGAARVSSGFADVHGLSASPDGEYFVQYGKDTAAVFAIANGTLNSMGSFRSGFEMYCCAFLDETTAWVAGAYGQILSIDLAATKPTFFKLKQRNRAQRHINAIAVSENGKRIFCAGGWSHLAALRKSGSVLENYVAGRKPTTPPAIRSALSQYASDQVIHDDIFDPGSLKRKTIVELDELLGEADFVSCAHSPEMPILAVGTNEGIVLLIDTRDGQIFQEIEVSKGAPGSITGLGFLADGQLAVMTYDGIVLFLTAKRS